MTSREQLLEELRPFCDIGQQLPKISEVEGKFIARMVRDGKNFKIQVDRDTGKVQVNVNTNPAKYFPSLTALLASDLIANLVKWADAQRDLFRQTLPKKDKLIPLKGITNTGEEVTSVDEISQLINSSDRGISLTEILLIDGPAGIGKTTIIEQLAMKRAEDYRTTVRPLILHVKSRGRVLSNLQDLMAFSLQTLRSPITYDQLPVLVKHGLVTLAIDGFDELGDPNGYESAWSQLGELVSAVRGRGALILSGRDTFISRDRLVRDVKALIETDIVTGLTVEGPTPDQSKNWLKKVHNWHESDFNAPAISSLLDDPGSFALRPVFLKIMGDIVKPKTLRNKPDGFLTPLLVRLMAERESNLFGEGATLSLGKEGLYNYVIEFMYEVARDMADSQTEALDSSSLFWLAEAALGSGLPPEIVAMIANRSSVVAFLINDDRAGFKCFVHSYLMNYFLAKVTLTAVSNGDIPKFLRRNILGPEFLKVFVDVAAEMHSQQQISIEKFKLEALRISHSHGQMDRGMRNAASLLLAVTPFLAENDELVLVDYQADEAVIRGTSQKATLDGLVINQLDARGADLTELRFVRSSILQLIADGSTRVPPSFPTPKYVLLDGGRDLSEPTEIEKWADAHGKAEDQQTEEQIVTPRLRKHGAYKLLNKACRFRQYWLRTVDDEYAAKVLEDPEWEYVVRALRKFDFVREEERPASGRPSMFVHIRHRERLLSEGADDLELSSFFKYLDEICFE